MAIRSPQVAKDILQSMQTGPKNLVMNIGKSEKGKGKGSDGKGHHGGLVQKEGAERNHMGNRAKAVGAFHKDLLPEDQLTATTSFGTQRQLHHRQVPLSL